VDTHTDSSDTQSTIIDAQPLLMERFKVLDVLGEGAAGAVYRVSDRDNGYKECALKVLINKSAFDENTLERFKEEVRICQKIRHANIVRAYELIELSDAVAFTMEYVQGSDISKFVGHRRPRLEAIDSIIEQVLAALDELHSHGILHRDIKLENILLRKDGVVKLIDLGLMKNLENQGLTRTGVLLGTAQYMAPEYIKGSQYDARSDIYAVGIVIYELVTGQRRLADKPGNEVIDYLLKTKFKIPQASLSGVPKKYLHIIERAMHPNPKKRFQTAMEMREAVVSVDHPLVDADQGEVQSALDLHEYSKQNKHVEKGNDVNAGRLYVVIMLSCAALLIGVLCLFLLSPAASVDPSEIPVGYYQGTVNSTGEQEGVNRIWGEVTSDGIKFNSDVPGCSSGEFSFTSGISKCDGTFIDLKISTVSQTEFRGSLSIGGDSHPFHLFRMNR